MPALERMMATRVVTTPTALEATVWPADMLVLHVAPDELLVVGNFRADLILSHDPHAIVVAETGFASVWLTAAEALDFLERACEWELPRQRPAFAQGAVAGLPLKLYLEADRVLFIVPAPFMADLQERLA